MWRRYRPALLPSGKPRGMTRQIALGAVVAFSLTVLGLSLWEPKPVVAPSPVPVAEVPQAPAAVPGVVKTFRPATLTQNYRMPIAVGVPAAPAAVGAVDAGAAQP
jgi:hypothetical protein